MTFTKPLAQLIGHLERLPGVGPKSAQRLAFHILRMPEDDVRRLAESLVAAREQIRLCEICQNVTAQTRCEICSDSRRDSTLICVVGEPKDIAAMERLNEYRGLYHVLHGLLNPMDGVGPDNLKIRELLSRLSGPIEEIIIATNPTVEGDATALYLGRQIKQLGIKVTRLAHGMPVGGELDYADSATLLSALEYRREL
ncbi:MAG: recombination protein RecR [Armatimonadetes bacterium]|nr:recombination protein RecR [Armatimonadota bacterium]